MPVDNNYYSKDLKDLFIISAVGSYQAIKYIFNSTANLGASPDLRREGEETVLHEPKPIFQSWIILCIFCLFLVYFNKHIFPMTPHKISNSYYNKLTSESRKIFFDKIESSLQKSTIFFWSYLTTLKSSVSAMSFE